MPAVQLYAFPYGTACAATWRFMSTVDTAVPHALFVVHRFSLVDRSASRLFGVALAHAASESMESGARLLQLYYAPAGLDLCIHSEGSAYRRCAPHNPELSPQLPPHPQNRAVGALFELTHLVRADQPGQPLLLVNARVVGRFQTTDVLCSEPFVTGARALALSVWQQGGLHALRLPTYPVALLHHAAPSNESQALDWLRIGNRAYLYSSYSFRRCSAG